MEWISPHIIIEATCLILALIYLRHESNAYWKLAIWFLFITICVEVTGFYVLRKILHVNNAWIYNFYSLIKIGYVGLMFYYFFSDYIRKPKYLLMGLAVPLISFVIETVFHGILVYHSITNTIMSVVFVSYGWYYFYQLLKSPQYVDLNTHASFWWISGISFFCFGSVVCDLAFSYINIFIDGVHTLRYYIFIVLNILLYGFWSYSFLCRHRIMKLQSS